MGERADRYRRLTLAEKQVRQRDQMREPAVPCPQCDTKTTTADLLQHIEERCTGPREPHPQSRWITWREALRLGVPKPTMSRWVRRGLVGSRGELHVRQYLLRDLVVRLAERRARRGSTNGTRRRRP